MEKVPIERYRKLSPSWNIVFMGLSFFGILLAVNQIFMLRLSGTTLLNSTYLYFILGAFLPMAFLIYPASRNASRDRVPWYDVIFFLLSMAASIYFGLHAIDILNRGWEFSAPLIPTVFSVIIWALAIEAARRAAGVPLAFVCVVFSFFPLYAGYMPGFLRGQDFDLLTTARNHVMSTNAIMGVPMDAIGNLIIGFLIFGVVLTATGGGDFFLGIALALLGRVRGGTAKVSVVSSALFGMLSGSAVSNVITTGSMTIPAMKRSGYQPYQAAAVEACASTGGAIMPPVMGASAFIMATFLNRPYSEVIIAAAIPAILYYLAIFIQVDSSAAKNNLKGLPASEIPSLGATIKSGWMYVLVVAVLFYLLILVRAEARAAFYASVLLIILSMFNKKTRLKTKDFLGMLAGVGRIIAEMVAILAAVGLLVGALSITGVGLAFSRELVVAVGDNLLLILLAGALTSFVLGMGMTSTACYIFLAIVMAPALIAQGVDPFAAHLFVLYWGLASFITPPVALAAYTAAGIGGANPIQTGFQAMRYGIVIYIVPFFFVYQPALIARGTVTDIIFAFATSIVGVYFLASAIEGYVLFLGNVRSLILRAVLIITGLLFIVPNVPTTVFGMVIIAGVYGGNYAMGFFKRPTVVE